MKDPGLKTSPGSDVIGAVCIPLPDHGRNEAGRAGEETSRSIS